MTPRYAVQIMDRIEEYKQIIADLNNEAYPEHRPLTKADIYADYGRKFVKISVGNRIHTFVVWETFDNYKCGDILKAATYRAPAKNGVRGNIWSDDGGASVVDWFGAKYLK